MAVKERREINLQPLFFKFGVGFVISFGGIFYAYFRSKNIPPPPSGLTSSDEDCSWNKDCDRDDDDDDYASEMKPSLANGDPSSSCGKNKEDEESYLPSEFGEVSTENITKTPSPSIESARKCLCTEQDEHIREIRTLKYEVNTLEEKVRSLEVQLQACNGLKEQETAILELRNRVRISSTEAKLHHLTIESLESDKRRLEAQVSSYSDVAEELAAAKEKIKALRKKLKCEAEQNRGQLLSLQERVRKLQDEEDNVDIEREKRKQLEEIKKDNRNLRSENSEYADRLECLQMLATSALDNGEEQELKEKNQLLQKQNNDFMKEIDQLRGDRCQDLEELVYLRWINACLRYELRNYQPSRPGQTLARDLSKTLSPKSEQRAKQLIFEYANGEEDANSDHWSATQSLPCPDAATHSIKSNIFSKLMMLLRVKDTTDQHGEGCSLPESIFNNKPSRYSTDSIISDGFVKSRHSLDLNGGRKSSNSSRTSSDLSIFATTNSMATDLSQEFQPYQEAETIANAELVRYAEALKNTSGKASLHRRSAISRSF